MFNNARGSAQTPSGDSIRRRVLPGGFTLIELLVVIAIIGILAGIVLAALGSARTTALDTGVKGNITTVRKQADIYANTNFLYGIMSIQTAGTGTSCGNGTGMWGDPTIMAATKAAASQGQTATSIGGVASRVSACYSTNTSWFFATILKSNNLFSWCVDSTGKSGTTTTASIVAGTVACP